MGTVLSVCKDVKGLQSRVAVVESTLSGFHSVETEAKDTQVCAMIHFFSWCLALCLSALATCMLQARLTAVETILESGFSMQSQVCPRLHAFAGVIGL